MGTEINTRRGAAEAGERKEEWSIAVDVKKRKTETKCNSWRGRERTEGGRCVVSQDEAESE